MQIENGIYYTDETLTIANIYDVIKSGFEEAMAMALEGKIKGFVAEGFDKKYGWNGTTYYELLNLDYQDLSEYNPSDDEDAQNEEDADDLIRRLRAENGELKDEVGTLKPYADKYMDNIELIEFFERYRSKNDEKYIVEIDRYKDVMAGIADDAKSILNRIEE
jgi:hypothetical protein